MWQEVSSLVDQGIPTVVAYDFNCIVGLHEKRGSRPFVDNVEFKEFRDFIHSIDLVDHSFISSRFIWCNNHRGASIQERIGRVLVITN